MRVRVEQVDLPGIGVRHDLVTEAGRRIGVVSHRSGKRDLVLFDRTDPDASSDQVALTDDEAEVLAEILGASLMLGQLAGLREQAAGLLTEQITLPRDSPYVDRPLGDSRARTRTGVSIVALLREGQAPLATAYVLIIVVVGSLLARLADTTWFKRALSPGPSTEPPRA